LTRQNEKEILRLGYIRFTLDEILDLYKAID